MSEMRVHIHLNEMDLNEKNNLFDAFPASVQGKLEHIFVSFF